MQCNRCGAALPTGASSCPVCGNPTPYNVGQGSYDPTALASSPYGAPPPPAGLPPTNYGASPLNPYEAPPPPATPYGASQSGTYGTPPPVPNPYGPPPAPRKSNVGRVLLIIGIIVFILLAACIGSLIYVVHTASNSVTTTVNNLNAPLTAEAATATAVVATANSTMDTTPTTTTGTNPSGPSPSGSPVSTSAAAIITSIQMADQVNGITPTHLTTTFKVHQTIYATFQLSGQNGYAVASWYLDGIHAFNSKVLTVKSDYTGGYFSAFYNRAGQGAVELYWCTKSDCSDAQLAQTTTFIITS
jgi:hypothetical protein